MNATPISKDIALRIGLAARELPETDAARLLRVLGDVMPFPPSAKKLSTLTVKALKSAADGEFSDMDTAVLKSALSYLKGESEFSAEPLPEVEVCNRVTRMCSGKSLSPRILLTPAPVFGISLRLG